MPHPTFLAYGFAVLMVAVSTYCIGRLVAAKRWGRRNHYDVNVSHILMGLAMIGMLIPRWNVIPNGLWETVFGVIALWFLALSVRFVRLHGFEGTDADHLHHISHYLIHTVMACAMLYMYWLGMPITTSAGATTTMMSGPPAGAGDPALTLFILAVLITSAVWQLDSITEFSPRQLALSVVGSGGGESHVQELRGAGERWLAPRLEVACHIAMCLTMGYMLVLMV
jgi:hypothetical protein